MEDRPGQRIAYAAIAVLGFLLVAGVLVFVTSQRPSRPLEVVSPTSVPDAKSRWIKVYVSGEVARPGVYTLADDDRIDDAVTAAGGPTEDADLNRVNLAVRVRDQMQIHVPKQGTSADLPGLVGLPSQLAKININSAGISELDTLPGIGQVTARRIIAYRQEKGPFRSIEDLKETKLVNNATYERIKDLIEAR
ncbi:MAG: helix-hairpin-helix domain-containing protein [Chloroflexi bacterium]|nr:helix-hairpin-helix domain-containing protein [Chloroflexota bacterium]